MEENEDTSRRFMIDRRSKINDLLEWFSGKRHRFFHLIHFDSEGRRLDKRTGDRADFLAEFSGRVHPLYFGATSILSLSSTLLATYALECAFQVGIWSAILCGTCFLVDRN